MSTVNKRFENLKGISGIVDAMIQGLNHQWVKIDMDSYGHMVKTANDEKVCYGCAATNILCELMGEAFEPEHVSTYTGRAFQFNFNISRDELDTFETAIDGLRRGDLWCFWDCLNKVKHLFPFSMPSFDSINWGRELPYLSTGYWRESLPEYEEYRDWLIEKGL